MSAQPVGKQNLSLDFAEISSANEKHAQAWQYGMDTARLELDTPKLKSEFVIWALANEIPDVEHFQLLPDWRFITIGRMAWLMNNGAEIPEGSAEYLVRQIEVLKQITTAPVVVQEDYEIPMTSDIRKTISYVNLYSFIDAVGVKFAASLDELEQNVLKRIKDVEPPQAMLKKLFNHYKENLDDALNERNNELVEQTIKPLATIVNVLAACTGNAKAIAAVKKKVSARVAKAASKATVKIVDENTNIVGLSPVLVVGNTAALVYNTKNRKAFLYVAKEGETLGIRGTYITGYDETASFGKTLRKPKDTFGRGFPNIKRVAQVLGDYIAGKRHTCNGKLNKETVIVKVFK